MKTRLACLMILAAGPAAAQTADWSFSGSLYGWLPALSTSIDTGSPAGTVNTDLSISDAVGDLKFAFMGTLQAQRGPLHSLAT